MIIDEARQSQVKELLDGVVFNKLSIDVPPEKMEDGQVTETIRKSKQIKDCSFGELLSVLQQGKDKGFGVEIKINFKEAKN